jgi:hexosaminidase
MASGTNRWNAGRAMVRAGVPLLAVLGTVACATTAPSPAPRAPTAAASEAPMHAVIPIPMQMEMVPADTFTVDTATVILVATGDAEAERIGHYLARLIGTTQQTTPRVVTATAPDAAAIRLRVEQNRDDLGDEGYDVVVARDAVTVTGHTHAGLFHGVQTLRQIMPPDVEYTATLPRPLLVPGARVTDRPRFEWRGMMLDVSRHFLQVHEVKRFIDHMALYRLNRLHLHLSDDQGWRIEIRSWPNLGLHGGSSAVGGHPGGYYTQEQYADIVRYAAEHYITVVPEIDMPGHTNAALSSYAELNCDDVAPPLYTGIRVGFSTLCVDRDVTYRFIDDVVREISALTPGQWFHMGGDEVEKLTKEQYRAFVERVERIVNSHGKTMIGWSEIAPANLSSSAIVQHWHRDSVQLAVARGSKVILSPSSKIYLDMKYDDSTPIGLTWAARIELRDAYDWEPGSWLEGVPESAILGVEAPLWSETLGTIHDFEYLAFPRLAAVAELGWSLPQNRDWEDFRRRAREHTKRWQALGINYYPSPQLRQP